MVVVCEYGHSIFPQNSARTEKNNIVWFTLKIKEAISSGGAANNLDI